LLTKILEGSGNNYVPRKTKAEHLMEIKVNKG